MPTEPDIERLFEEIEIEVAFIKADELFALCPNPDHPDRRPGSWSLNLETLTHWCFACESGGTLEDLVVQRMRALGIRPATPWSASTLMKQFGIEQSNEVPESYWKLKQGKPSLELLPEEVFDGLDEPPEHLLRRRRISRTAARYYGIRWNPEKRCWVTPIRMHGGACIGWQEKGIGWFSNEPPGVQKGRTLFGIDRMTPGETPILMESPLDVARLYTAGYPNGVAAFGVHVTDDQMRELLSLDVPDIILALDNDRHGEAVTHRLITGTMPGKPRKKYTAWHKKIPLYVFNYRHTTAKDIGEMRDDEIEWAIEKVIAAEDYV